MIIKGGSRANGGFFARYFNKELEPEEGNVRAEMIDMRGTVSNTIAGWIQEVGDVASGTRCKNPFYHIHFNPSQGERLTREQKLEAVDHAAKELGLDGLPRFVVEHEKKDGREHFHAFLSRIDGATMTARSDSNNFEAHERIARALEIKFDLERVKGAFDREPDAPRPERRPEDFAGFRGQKSGIDPNAIKAELSDLWRTTDSGRAFASAVAERGYVLARGDRRDFVLIDHAGGDHSLARRLAGVKAADVRERMADVDRNTLPSVAEARTSQQARFTRDGRFDPSAARAAWENRHPDRTPDRTLEPTPEQIRPDSPRVEKDAPDLAPVFESTAARDVPTSPPNWFAYDPLPPELQRPAIPTVEPAAPEMPPGFERAQRDVADAWERADGDGRLFAAGMQARSYVVARVSAEDAWNSFDNHARALAEGRYAARHEEGDFVFVHREGQVYRLGKNLAGDERNAIRESLADMDGAPLPTLAKAREMQRGARNPDYREPTDTQARPVAGGLSVSAAGNVLCSLADFLCDMLAGPSEPPKFNHYTFLEQIEKQERAAAALESIRLSIERGDSLRGEDIRSLTPEQLKTLAAGGDDAMRYMLMEVEKERDPDRSIGRER